MNLKKLLWVLFAFILMFSIYEYVVVAPALIASDFLRGVYYPIAISISTIMAIAVVCIFDFQVFNKGKEE